MIFITDKIWKEKERLITTAALYVAFIAHGLGLGITGPTMLDLQISTSSSLDQITYMIIGRAFGLAVGSLFNTLLLKICDGQLILAVSLGIAGVLEAVAPFMTNVWILVTVFFFNGCCVGIVETCCNCFLIQLWGKSSSAFLQALHFCFGFGCFVAPLAVRPFLINLTEEDIMSGLSTNFSPGDVTVWQPYLVVSAVMIFGSLFVFYTYLRMRTDRTEQRDKSCGNSPDIDVKALAITSPKQTHVRLGVYISGMMFMFFYCGVEISLGSYLPAFAVKCDLHLSKATGALLASVFWITFTFSRLATIFYIDYIGPRNNLMMALAMIALSNGFLVCGNHIEWCLWVGVALNGIGMSSIWASLFSFISNYMAVTGNMTSLIVSASCFGESVIPIIISAVVDRDVMIFLWVTLACSIILVILFTVLYLLLHIYFLEEERLKQNYKISPVNLTNTQSLNILWEEKNDRLNPNRLILTNCQNPTDVLVIPFD
jgi:FHS family Na+ dependent glucose MFS transporter 1